jgi:hypothetical protein
LRSAQPTYPLCSQATYAVSKLLRQKDAVFFWSQHIAEFWNVATRPADANGLGFAHEAAILKCRRKGTPWNNRPVGPKIGLPRPV